MDFLNKILSHLGQDPNKQFRKQVQAEKKQKYLFSDDLTDKYRSKRSGFFSRKKKVIAPFANSFTSWVSQIKKRFDESHILAYMGLFLLCLSGYIIFFSPYFRVSPSHVLLEANNEGIDVSVAYRAIEDIYGTSIFFLDETEVATTLKKSLKNLAHVSIDKLYPNGVKVLMTSTPIWYKAKVYGYDREWAMSDNGVLIPKMSSGWTPSSITPGLKSLEIISESLRGEVFFDYKQVIGDEHMLLVNKIISLFETEWKDISITKIRYFARENEIHIALTSGTHIILTLESETSAQDYTSRVNSIKNQLIGLSTYIDKYKAALTDGQMTYIDARIVKKIFTCKAKDVCINNLIRIYGDTYK